MKVAQLLRILKRVDPELEIRIDDDDEGYYNLDSVEIYKDIYDADNSYVNLISSNEI